MLDISKVRAISLDLDDTLWPTRPTIERAEKSLSGWLAAHAPGASAVLADPQVRKELRAQALVSHPDWAHDLGALRREAIRLALHRGNEDTALATPAFEVFLAERMRVDLFDDARPALDWLAQHFPIVALSNGNADVDRVGLGRYFAGAVSAASFGVGKPDPRIFHAAAACAKVAPGAVLHVGDDAALDVLGALGAGLQAVWVNRADQPWSQAQAPHAAVTDLDQLCALLRPGV